MNLTAKLSAALLSLPTIAQAGALPNLRVLTQNLHGYHPMGEPARYLEARGGEIKRAEPYLTYFSEEEIERGQRRQLTALGEKLTELQPDIIFLQEVGAGLPSSPKTCAEFGREAGGDAFGRNSALRLRDRLNKAGAFYSAAVACRGNIGWRTDANTFRTARVWRGEGAERSLVYDFDANPYPEGFLVEGTAILAKAPWRLEEARAWNIPLAKAGESFFFQTARLRHGSAKEWLLAVNLHGKWNIRHFEAAMELRRQIDAYIQADPDRAHFSGLLIGGDFNAPLLRPSQQAEAVASLPWEVERIGEFNYGPSAPPHAWEDLRARLWALNFKNGEFTNELGGEAEARERTDRAFQAFRAFVNEGVNERLPLQEALLPQNCAASRWPAFEAACSFPKRIDLLFLSPQLKATAATVLFSGNTFFTTKGISDHPGLLVDLSVLP